MTKTEIYRALDLLRDTLIQAHVAMNSAIDQTQKLMQQVQSDVAVEQARVSPDAPLTGHS